MSQLIEKLKLDLKTSLKGGNKERTGALRFLISKIQYARIEKQEDLDDSDVLRVLGKQAKERKESIDAYREAGRDDLLDKEKRELEIIEEYLPEQMGAEEIGEILHSIIESESLSGMSDLGRLMKSAMPRFQGRAEGSLVSQMAKEELQRIID